MDIDAFLFSESISQVSNVVNQSLNCNIMTSIHPPTSHHLSSWHLTDLLISLYLLQQNICIHHHCTLSTHHKDLNCQSVYSSAQMHVSFYNHLHWTLVAVALSICFYYYYLTHWCASNYNNIYLLLLVLYIVNYFFFHILHFLHCFEQEKCQGFSGS